MGVVWYDLVRGGCNALGCATCAFKMVIGGVWFGVLDLAGELWIWDGFSESW